MEKESRSLMKNIIRVAMIGPESVGKTTLSRRLADHYHTVFVPEFARDYIGNLQRPYTCDDILYCIDEQIKHEEKLIPQANKIIFSDTETIISHVWLQDVFNICDHKIEDKIIRYQYDLYLLLKPDIPFIKDPLRENPERREYFFDWYKRELEKRNFNYEIISGESRFEDAIFLIEELLKAKK